MSRPTESTKRDVWVLAGGRCCLCKRKVLDNSIKLHTTGEVAHAAGHGSDPDSTPRHDDTLDVEQKRSVDNLLLLCETCHTKVDTKTLESVYDFDTIEAIKIEHEKLVDQLLSLMDSNTSLVIRALGTVRDVEVGADRLEVAAALAKRGRRPVYVEGLHHREIEVDLSQYDEASEHYWSEARRQLEPSVARVRDAIASGVAEHLSVFAFLRTPLLVLLVWLLDDTFRVDVIQRSRATAWMPDPGAEDHRFEASVSAGEADASELVVVLGLTGAVPEELLPEEVQTLPQVRISPVDGYDAACLNSIASQQHFDRTLSRALGFIEQTVPRPDTVHVVCGAPIYACLQLGRALQPEIYPRVVVYDAPDHTDYRPALTLNTKDRP